MGITKEQIQKEQGALKDFATAIGDILAGLGAAAGSQTTSAPAAPAGVSGGILMQHVSDASGGAGGGATGIAGNPVVGMPEVDLLNAAYQAHHAGTQGNVAALISTLQLVQSVAGDLEKIYSDAQQTESLSADQVKQAFTTALTRLATPVGGPPTAPAPGAVA